MNQQPTQERAPVRDNHGHVLPDDTSAPARPLADLAIDTGLAALPGWERRGHLVVRQVRVPPDSRDGLMEGVLQAVGDDSRVGFEDDPDALAIVLGAQGSVLPSDLEAAARVDAVLSGSGRDTGTTS